VRQVIMFLEGKNKDLIESLKKKMEEVGATVEIK
jgi:ribosomal protein L7/L12